jgi:hypothetical protein
MDEDNTKRDALRLLEAMRERLQRELQALAARRGSGLGRHSDDPYAAELEYHLTRLGAALNAIRVGHHTLELYSRRDRAELLAQIDAVMTQSKEIYDIAERAREVLLRPPPEEPGTGFTE